MGNIRHTFKIFATKFSQKEGDDKAIYVGKIKVKEFAIRTKDRFKIDFFKRVNGEDTGYQRQLYDDSVEKFKDYVLNQSPAPIVPTAITVNAESPLDFKILDPLTDYGELTINQTLSIIDGQHRFEAWKGILKEAKYYEEWKDYELPIIILSGFNKTREIELFYVMNSRQRRIKTDLALRILLKLKKDKETEKIIPSTSWWQPYAVVIADALNEEVDNVWKGKIIIEGDSKELRRSKIIGQNSFVMSLKHFFTQSDPLFDINNQNVSTVEYIRLLADFWNIIAKAYPLSVKYPRDYSLMKTVGVYSMHFLLNNIAKNNGEIQNRNKILEIAKENILRASNPVSGNYQIDFWKSRVPKNIRENGRYGGAYSSHQGHIRLAAGIAFNSIV